MLLLPHSWSPMHAAVRYSERLGVVLTVLGVLASGCRSRDKMAAQCHDALISAKVQADLAADRELDPFDYQVTTQQRVVVLQGRTSSDQARRRAVQIATTTPGVLRVRDELQSPSK